jgi:Domain of unknown function (DUF4160)
MPTIANENGMKIVVWSNDHQPPHVHVFGKDWEVRVLIGAEAVLYSVDTGNPYSKQVSRAVELVGRHLEACNSKWREIHG